MGVSRYEVQIVRTEAENALFIKLGNFLTKNEYTKDKLIWIISSKPISKTAVLFGIQVDVNDVNRSTVFSVLKGSNSPLKAIGEIVRTEEDERVIFLEMDLAH